MKNEEAELIEQLRDLEITKRELKSKLRDIQSKKQKKAFHGFQLGDRVYARTKGTLNVRSGTVTGITSKKISYKGDCGTKTWRKPSNLQVTDREKHNHEL